MAPDLLTASVKPLKRPGLYWVFSDSLVLIGRSIRHILKNPDQLASVAIQPIMFMLLFRYVFGGAINTGGTTYVNFLVAGILVQTAAFGATTTAVNISSDLTRGIIDRFKSLPIFDTGVLIGHVVSDLVRNTVSAIIMIGVAFLVGFRPSASAMEWVMVFGLLLLFTFALSWLSAILGLMASSPEAVQWMTFLFIFPLTFASSAYVPTVGMPKILRIFAENQPVTHVIEALRAWLVGTPIGNHAWWALAWCLGIIIISVPVSTMLYKHKGRN